VSYCVTYSESKVGLLLSFVKIKHCNCLSDNCDCGSKFYAVINQCTTNLLPEYLNCTHIHEISTTSENIVVDVSELCRINYYINMGDREFCAKPIMKFEFN